MTSLDCQWLEHGQGVSRIKKPVFCVCLPGKHTKNYGKSPCLMGISTISLAMSLRYVSFQRVYVLMLSSLLVFLWPRWENGRTERSDKKSSLRVTLSPNNGGSQALLVNLYCFGVTNMVPSGTQTWQWTFATSNFRLILNFNDFPIEIPKNKSTCHVRLPEYKH